MIVLGLTGSIAMGKSFSAKEFIRQGIPVFDADKAVHILMGKQGRAVPFIEAVFPGSTKDGAIDRPSLSKYVFEDKEGLAKLEAILHPMVWEEERRFLEKCRRQKQWLVVLEVPLLYEKQAHLLCDYTAVVSAPAFIQERRALKRSGMTKEKFKHIRSLQMPDWQKRKRADYIIPSGLGKHVARHKVREIIQDLYRKR